VALDVAVAPTMPSAIVDVTFAAFDANRRGSRLVVTLGASPVPSGCGLKTSSTIVNALVVATAASTRMPMSPANVVSTSTDVQRRCGLTTTGSVDDTWGTLVGGIVIADGRTKRLLLRTLPPADVVAVVFV